jgi:hypothetical protein
MTLPFDSTEVERVLAASDHPWTVATDGDGGQLLARVGVRIGKLAVYKHVQLRVGEASAPVPTDWLMVPVSWQAVGGPPIFPGMEGTLHVQSAGPRLTKLTLNARYDPPLGKLGELIDRVVMHQVAGLTMSDFIERLGEALNAELESRSERSR